MSAHGHALIDRELYLPQSWIEDRDRCSAARIPPDVGFATKPRLAEAMIGRAIVAGVPFAWFTADEVYGEAGLDHYQVRDRRAWHAHITLSMLALAWLAASKAQAVKGESAPATRA